jgi:predicted nicotinamide N-methyase
MEPATTPPAGPTTIHTPDGDLPLHECRLAAAGKEWTIMHVAALLSLADEYLFLRDLKDHLPYGLALWPAAIALAYEIASRAHEFQTTSALELGAGTGLPGIAAASLGANVVQTDRQEPALTLCQRNGARNALTNIHYRLADWASWDDDTQYDWILGSDILYGHTQHPHLQRIFETNLAQNGRILLSDPFRQMSIRLLESLENAGWSITMSKWRLGDESDPRPIGVFQLHPPHPEIQ